MKQITIVCTIMLMLLTACAGSQMAGQQEETTKAPATPGRTNVAPDLTAMFEEVKQDTLAKNKLTEEFVLPLNFKAGKVGDTVAFGTMFNQVNKAKGAYLAKVTFVEARDKSSNKIEVDKAMLASWLRTSETEPFVLEEKGSQYIPVIVTIKDEIKPGVKTVSGSYQFEIQFYERTQNTFDQKLDRLVKQIYVRVE